MDHPVTILVALQQSSLRGVKIWLSIYLADEKFSEQGPKSGSRDAQGQGQQRRVGGEAGEGGAPLGLRQLRQEGETETFTDTVDFD